MLQATVVVLALVPIGAGFAGAALGMVVFGAPLPLGNDADSTGRYLCGVLLAIGIAFWTTVPDIVAQGVRFRMLAALVVTGGLARFAGLVVAGQPSPAVLAGLAMELGVTPALVLWRERLERACRG